MGVEVVTLPQWERVWEFEEWKAAVLAASGQTIEDYELGVFYGYNINPQDAARLLPINRQFRLRVKSPEPVKVPKAPRVVVLGIERIEQRIALAIWKECARLLARRMTPEAKALVIETRDKVAVLAGIDA